MEQRSNTIVVRLSNREGTEYAEISGTFDKVRELLSPYLARGEFTIDPANTMMKIDTPTLVQNVSVSEINGKDAQSQSNADLLSFYRKVSPKSQPEELHVIAYYWQILRGRETVSQADFEAAYRELVRVPVKAPKHLNSAVQNAIHRKQGLRQVKTGHYILTEIGKEQVEALLQK